MVLYFKYILLKYYLCYLLMFLCALELSHLSSSWINMLVPITLFSPSLLRSAAYSWGHQKKKKIRSFHYILQPDPPYSMGYFFTLLKTFIFITPPPPKLRYENILSFKKSDLSLSCPNSITVKSDESETVVKHRKKGERKSWKLRKIWLKVAFQIYALAQHEIVQKWTA